MLDLVVMLSPFAFLTNLHHGRLLLDKLGHLTSTM